MWRVAFVCEGGICAGTHGDWIDIGASPHLGLVKDLHCGGCHGPKEPDRIELLLGGIPLRRI